VIRLFWREVGDDDARDGGPQAWHRRAGRVTDTMLQAAANALGELSPARIDQHASVLPPIDQLRDATVHVATAAAAVRDDVAPRASEDELRTRVAAAQWSPRYT
jgi:malate dehydrogenase (oxaloacetate-decarboxylating)